MQPTQSAPAQPDLSQYGAYASQAQNFLNQGYSPQSVQQAFSSQGLGQPSPQTQPQSHGNWFERQLPTIGGIAGGLLGSLTDAFTGPLGTIGGAAGGGALGQELENALTGSKGSTLGAGVSNAIGGAVGGIAGKGISLLAGKALAPLADTGASKLFAGQAPGVTKTLADYMTKDLGLSGMQDAGKLADVLTGPSGGENPLEGRSLVNQFVENTLNNQGPQKVNVGDLFLPKTTGSGAKLADTVAGESSPLQNIIKNNYLSGTNYADGIKSKISAVSDGVKQDIQGRGSPLDVLNAQRQISGFANDAYEAANRTGDSSMLNVAKTYSDVSNLLKQRLSLGEIKVNPVDANALANDITKFGGAVNKNAASKIASEISTQASSPEGLTLAGLRNTESNWVAIKNALQSATDKAEKNFGASTSDLARQTLPIAGAVAQGPAGLIKSGLGLATSSPTLDKYGSKALLSLAKGAKGKVVQKILPALAKASAIGLANQPLIAENTPASASGGALSQLQNNPNQNGGNGMNGNNGQLSPLEQMYIAGTIDPFQYGNVLNTLAPLIQKGQIAQNAMSTLPSLYAQAGGGQGPMGGLLSNLEGMIPGTPQYNYMQARNVAAKAGQPFGVSSGFMPSFMQTPQGAQGLFGANQSLLSGAGL